MAKRPYIPLGCDQQGRLRPTFLDRPQAHTQAQRDSKSATDYACAVERYERSDDIVSLVDAILMGIFIVSIASLVAGFI